MKFIEVCAGAGGLSQGFINKGFEPVLLIDNDKYCCRTLEKNHKDVNIICKDFREVKFDKYKGIDLLLGGISCQSYSYSGKRKGLNDPRGSLMLDFINLINFIKPKVFLIENVKGLLTHDKGNTFNIIINSLKNINKYNIYHKVLNANDYNVPQKRERLFIIGVKKEFIWPEKCDYKPVLNDVLQNVPHSKGYTYPENKRKIMELVPQGGCWVDLPEDIQKSYMKGSYNSSGGKRGIARRLAMNAPSLTLTTAPSQKQTERCHPIETRPLTIREYARIQTFPDNYEFIGSIANQYKQIGNAVPVKLAEHIAESIMNVLNT